MYRWVRPSSHTGGAKQLDVWSEAHDTSGAMTLFCWTLTALDLWLSDGFSNCTSLTCISPGWLVCNLFLHGCV